MTTGLDELREHFACALPHSDEFGEPPQEGKDWAIVPGISVRCVLYVVYVGEDGSPRLHVEDVETGNCTHHDVASEEYLRKFHLLPLGLRERLRELLGIQPTMRLKPPFAYPR